MQPAPRKLSGLRQRLLILIVNNRIGIILFAHGPFRAMQANLTDIALKLPFIQILTLQL
jgi:hypothetical protein